MKIVVLAGGTSTEREISLISGTGICRALRQKGHEAILIDIFCGLEKVNWEDPFCSRVYSVEDAVSYIKDFDDEIEKMKKTRKSIWGPNVLKLCDLADIVFLALHGLNGEDGRVQATFDLMGIEYTGTGFLSSGIAMDKSITKQFFLAHGIPTPRGISFRKDDMVQRPEDAGLSFPLVVKTCCGGSSVGVFIVHSQEEYERSLKEAFSYEDQVVVEEFIEGRELTVAVVDNKAYPVVEISPVKGFYDYRNKYEPGAAIETCPAQIPPEKTQQVMKLAETAALVLGLDTYCRLDFIMKENGELYCLEANTLPGMTPTSLIPQEAAVLGMDYPSLCEELIRVSRKRYQNSLRGTF